MDQNDNSKNKLRINVHLIFDRRKKWGNHMQTIESLKTKLEEQGQIRITGIENWKSDHKYKYANLMNVIGASNVIIALLGHAGSDDRGIEFQSALNNDMPIICCKRKGFEVSDIIMAAAESEDHKKRIFMCEYDFFDEIAPMTIHKIDELDLFPKQELGLPANV